MKSRILPILVVGLLFLGTSTYGHTRPILWAMAAFALLGLLLLVGMVGSVAAAIKTRHQNFRPWLLSSLLCLLFLASFPATISVGKAISDREFLHHVDDYSPIVQAFKDGHLACRNPCNARLAILPDSNYPKQMQLAEGAHCSDGGVVLLFLSPGNVPLNHAGYVFQDYGDMADCNQWNRKPGRSLYLRHIAGNWYHFSDGPDL